MREYLQAMDEGARDYIARPFALREIEQIVRSFAHGAFNPRAEAA
jgi:DNA-binding response OmpR family regulator